jgi:hypothetical protein
MVMVGCGKVGPLERFMAGKITANRKIRKMMIPTTDITICNDTYRLAAWPSELSCSGGPLFAC